MPAKVGPWDELPLNLQIGTEEGVTIVVESYISPANVGLLDGILLTSLRQGRTDGTILDDVGRNVWPQKFPWFKNWDDGVEGRHIAIVPPHQFKVSS